MENTQFDISRERGTRFLQPYTSSMYHVLLFSGVGKFSVDFTDYDFAGNTVLFFAPYQHFLWRGEEDACIDILSFHGDFYCIEYHKKEVACNGLLFNNIYQCPHIPVSDGDFEELHALFGKIAKELLRETADFSDAILKAYLQLILAYCSREKTRMLLSESSKIILNQEMTAIQNLIDTHFTEERSASFYASGLALSVGAFTKKTKQLFGKTPMQLIQDRVILEAKKLLHLTHKSVKEIAAELNFSDEFYFSRYFKKAVGLSPLHYREQVGISIVAK